WNGFSYGLTSIGSFKLAQFPVFHTNKIHLPLIVLSPEAQFKKVIHRMLLAAMAPEPIPSPATRPGLKKIAPYWYPYTTMAKGRWYDREILEVVSTEFRDRSVEYYRYALESGVTTINGKVAKPGTIIRNGDRLENIVHRHEPPVTSTPVRILKEDLEREFVVIDKPGSIPVHATGRYFYLSLVEILQREFGYKKVYTVNRLDRLTSGLMIIGLSSQRAHTLSTEFTAGTVRKEYIARCTGEFPDSLKQSSNDCTMMLIQIPAFCTVVLLLVVGPGLGKGGIDIVPSTERSAPVPPPQFQSSMNPEQLSQRSPSNSAGPDSNDTNPANTEQQTTGSGKLLPRETGHDIGMGSPVPLSAEAVGVITRLRNMKDEDEDWSRWRDVVFKAKGRLHPHGMKIKRLPPRSKRERGGPGWTDDSEKSTPASSDTGVYTPASGLDTPSTDIHSPVSMETGSESGPLVSQLTESEALERLQRLAQTQEPEPALRVAPAPDALTPELRARQADAQIAVAEENDGMLYCPECYLPLHPDPKPEKLYIFLHALRYTTSLGTFETEMPEWAAEGWEWDRS
ncbi:hypothetical protein EW146_g3647, partial [Bondarzewia mesenterica]